MAINFKISNQLLLVYEPENNSSWVQQEINIHGSVTIGRVFHFKKGDLHSTESDSDQQPSVYTFILGHQVGEYFSIAGRILNIKHDLQLHTALSITMKTFRAERGISIFRKIDKLIDEPIVVGGREKHSIPQAEFERLLKEFPNTTELNHYAAVRITRILSDYFGTMSDAQKKLDRYFSNKSIGNRAPTREKKFPFGHDIQKFEYVRDELVEMLAKADGYDEKDWQNIILDFVLLLFPKYILVQDNVQVKHYKSTTSKPLNRYIDIALFSADGAIDVIEIKKPFPKSVLSNGTYRNNYVPKRELSGSIMQVEKYIHYLNKWGHNGEKALNEKYKDKLPDNFQIQIINPRGMVILGRDNDLSDEQRLDFEIIKRKYANLIDLITYDDLLRRLDNIIATLKERAKS